MYSLSFWLLFVAIITILKGGENMNCNNIEHKADYTFEIVLENENEFKEYLNNLLIKYGKNNIPFEEAVKFNFKWISIPVI